MQRHVSLRYSHGHSKGIKYYTDTGIYHIITISCICLTWGRKPLLNFGEMKKTMPRKNNILMQASEILPTVSPFYGVNTSVIDVLEIF